MNEKARGSFSGKLGFVLAAAGSAVGLGNIWRFPYLTAKYGGGMFLLCYIIMAVTLGFSMMVMEVALGRKTGKSALYAYTDLKKGTGFIGWINALVPVIITPYYCVIGGWVLKYLVMFVSGQGTQAAEDGFFGSYISSDWAPLGWFIGFMAITVLVNIFGVEKGVERVSKYMMPLLVALSLVIAVYACCQKGAGEGVKYLFKPELSNFSFKTVLAAMTQMFYSLSLAMGIMVTYGSYMKKEVDIESSAIQISCFDTGIAILASLMIIPAVFAFSDPTTLKAGPTLMFITLPKLFAAMPGGQVVGALFFLLVLFAALTSSISLTETVASMVEDKAHLKRSTTCALVFAYCIVLGALSVFGYGSLGEVTIFGYQFLDFFDWLSNTVMMPIAAILNCVFAGYIVGPKLFIDEVCESSRFRRRKIFVVIVKYVAPVCIAAILLGSFLVQL